VSDVTDLIAAYRRGELTLDQLAQRFREHAWPERRPPPRAAGNVYRGEFDDPAPLQEGSFSEVIVAYDRGDISGDEYEVLARAAAEAGR
jgi:hypothetical protein